LSRHQAVEIRDSRFDDDFAQLANVLRTVPGLVMSGGSGANATEPSAAWRRWMLLAIPIVIAIAFYFALRPHAIDLNGAWRAEMQKAGQPKYRIRLDLVVGDGAIHGAVDYPTGKGVIENGVITGRKLTFETTHTPQFESAPAKISYTGEVVEDGIHLTSVDSNGVATGVAQRVAASGQP